MQRRLMALTIALMLLSGAGVAAAAQAPDAAHMSMTPRRDVALAHHALGEAERSLGNALQDMGFTSPNVQSNRAIDDAYEAQNSALRARALLPRGVRQDSPAHYQRSMNLLQEAAQDDRATIQALADLPVGKARDAALDQTRQALTDTQDAMIDIAPQLAS